MDAQAEETGMFFCQNCGHTPLTNATYEQKLESACENCGFTDWIFEPTSEQIYAGDTVYHKPSGESWYVLGVNYSTGKLCVAGWPWTTAEISDCELTERGNGITEQERESRTKMFGDGWFE